MSLGITPSDFVQQVLFLQEKTLLEFDPDDIVYKDVLMEANLVIQELQKEEDWLWLRDTIAVGHIGDLAPWHHRHHMHYQKFDIPDSVYKPSTLYGDCVRLCRYWWVPERLHPMWTAYKYWKKVMDEQESLDVSEASIYYGTATVESIDTADYKYDKSCLFSIEDVPSKEMAQIYKGKRWYIDNSGSLIISDADDHHVVYLIEIPENADLDSVPEPPEPTIQMQWHPWLWIPHGQRFEYRTIEDLLSYIKIDEFSAIKVPYVSAGNMYRRNVRQTNSVLINDKLDHSNGATIVGGKLTFTKPIRPFEENRIVLMDVQRRIKQFHICNDNCISRAQRLGGSAEISYPSNPCAEIEDIMLTEVPDPNYVVTRTAALHAESSPVAQNRVQGLTDQAQKLLSAMRVANAASTAPDLIEFAPMNFFNVV